MKRFFKKPSRVRKVRPILMAKLVEMRSAKGGTKSANKVEQSKVLTTQKADENNADVSVKAALLKSEEKKIKKTIPTTSESVKNKADNKQNDTVLEQSETGSKHNEEETKQNG